MEHQKTVSATLHIDKKWKAIHEQDQEYLKSFKAKNYCSYRGKTYVLLPKHIQMSDFFSKSLENADNQTLQISLEDELNPNSFDAVMKLIHGASDVVLEDDLLVDVYSFLKYLGIPSSKDVTVDPTFMKELLQNILKVLRSADYVRFHDRAKRYKDPETQDKITEMIKSSKLSETLTQDSVKRASLSIVEFWLNYHAKQKRLAISERKSTSDFLTGDKIHGIITSILESLGTQNSDIQKEWISQFVVMGPEEPSSFNNYLFNQVDMKDDDDSKKVIEQLKTNIVAINSKIDFEKERTSQILETVQNSIINHQAKQFEEQNAKIEKLEKLVMTLVSHFQKEETSQSAFVIERVSSLIETKLSELMTKIDDKISTILQKTEHEMNTLSSKFEGKLEKLQEEMNNRLKHDPERIEKAAVMNMDQIQAAISNQEKLCSESLEKLKSMDFHLNLFQKQNGECLEKLWLSFQEVEKNVIWNSIVMDYLGQSKIKSIAPSKRISWLKDLKKSSEPYLYPLIHSDLENTLKNQQIFDLFANKIHENIGLATLLELGFKIIFDENWSYQNKYSEITKLRDKYSDTALVCMAGQKKKNSGIIDLCAIGPIGEAFKTTSSATEAHQVGDVYWYCVQGKSFGFAETKDVNLSYYDKANSSGSKRMCWGFSFEGYRIGAEAIGKRRRK